ncbi:MAG: hypothetical protein H6767_03780 [Candidatus Peribacteria bacterium]|nr:MAG: hypothetical protein H6767_03780 [Candidatus Peribacteria bacterium]
MYLTDEERTQVAAMSAEERTAFFETKRSEMEAQRAAHTAVIDALIAGDALTDAQELVRQEIATQMNSTSNERKCERENASLVKKLVNGEELTDEEKTSLEEMQALHAEREAVHAEMQVLLEKQKN